MGKVLSVGSALQLTQYDIEDVHVYCNKKFTASEIESLYKRFRTLDRRHKGYVSSEELMAVPELAINPLAQRIIQIFENVNFKDFCLLLCNFSERSTPQDRIRFMFTVYDIDGDGAISRSDLLTMLRNRAGSQLTDEQLAELTDAAMAHLPAPRVPGEERKITFEAFCKEFETVNGTDVALKMKVPAIY